MLKIITAKKRIRLSFLLVAICSMQSMAQVQKELPCREPKVSKEKIDKIIQSRKMRTMNSELSTLAVIPPQLRVYFVICSDSDGTSAAATDSSARVEFKTMQSDFGPGNICLVLAGIGRLKDTYLNHMDVDAESDADDLFEAHRIPGCLTIFLTKEIRGTNQASGGGYGGITFDNPGTFCLVSNIGGHTSSHEAGHCLGLFHTFSSKGIEHERIDGSNCDIAGDLICDTYADPYVFKSEKDDCFSSSNGVYTGNCEDPGGNTNYYPPYQNIMSYWKQPPQIFTNGQFLVMRYTIQDDADVHALASVNDYIFYPATYNFEHVYKSANNSITTAGSINLNALTHAGLFAKVITLNPGFHAKPSDGGYTVIRATLCEVSATAQITSSRPVTSTRTELKTDDAAFLVYPNPTNGIITFTYKQDKVFNPSLVIRNIHGQVVYSLAKQKNTQQMNQRIDISKQPKGLYIIELNTGDKRITQKIILQ